ncbi:GNAT family N-acetyltransferase [Paenibacillus yanchengensis]|uniref:GNAT family N-acetyltransferase n=1 Tax=Paenibacillus yanchengensis TaxID=2035833 RepID=A0ABW4YN00_9BACL
MEVTIRKQQSTEVVPLSLLLLADPNEQLINSYLTRGTCIVAEYKEELVGVMVLLETRPATLEIVNIAVVERWQSNGIGSQLIRYAIQQAKLQHLNTVEIGTGNSSIQQLALYQKLGFRMTSIDHNFFVRNYNEAIFENGIPCVDMIRLSITL